MSEIDYVSFSPDGETTCTEPLKIIKEVFTLKDEAIQNRRWFHSHPELSFQEIETAAKVANLLRSYGIDEVFEQVGRVSNLITRQYHLYII